MNTNMNNRTSNPSPRISRVVPSNGKYIGLIIKHDLTDIRKKVARGIFIRYNDKRAPGDQWYLEAYMEESLDLAQRLLLGAEGKYLEASRPKPKRRPRASAPIHQNTYDVLDEIEVKKEVKKQEKKKFDDDFPSLGGSVAPQAAPVWVKDPPKPGKVTKKTQTQREDHKMLVLTPKPAPIQEESEELDDWETQEPMEVPTPQNWWGDGFYNHIPGAY